MNGERNESEQRAGDAERERAIATLRQATIEGKLTLEEFSERMDSAMAARTQNELATLTRDIGGRAPVAAGIASAAPPARPAGRLPITSRITSIISENRRVGRWRAEGQVDVVAVMGEAKVDLRQAEIVGAELVVRVRSMMSEVKIYVPEGLDVRFNVGSVLSRSNDGREATAILPGSPIVRIEGVCVMSEVAVLSREVGMIQRLREKFRGSSNS